MFNRHTKHEAKWEVVGNDYKEPATRIKGYMSEEQQRMFVFGMTTLTQRCTVCGEVKVTEHAGRVTGV